MHHSSRTRCPRSFRAAGRVGLVAALAAVVLLSGCASGHWVSRHADNTVLMSARADQVSDLQTRHLSHEFPTDGSTPVRIRNLAGRIEIVPGTGEAVVVEAVIHARGGSPAHTEELLESMQWTAGTDHDGRAEWALAYPVDRHRVFHYSHAGRGCKLRTNHLGGRIEITTEARSGVPTLFADLTIHLPAHAPVSVRSVFGDLRGGALAGTLDLDLLAGDATLESFQGSLRVDTGSGDVDIETVDGDTFVDTGSGDIHVGFVTGHATFDTGSGDIEIARADCEQMRLDTGSGHVRLDAGRVRHIFADTGSGGMEFRHVEFERLHADSGSGDIIIEGPFIDARHVHADTGSGDVIILAGPDASFSLHADTGSGDVRVAFPDAKLIRFDRRVIGAQRGDGRTSIHADTGSGDVIVRPHAMP